MDSKTPQLHVFFVYYFLVFFWFFFFYYFFFGNKAWTSIPRVTFKGLAPWLLSLESFSSPTCQAFCTVGEFGFFYRPATITWTHTANRIVEHEGLWTVKKVKSKFSKSKKNKTLTLFPFIHWVSQGCSPARATAICPGDTAHRCIGCSSLAASFSACTRRKRRKPKHGKIWWLMLNFEQKHVGIQRISILHFKNQSHQEFKTFMSSLSAAHICSLI